MNIGKRIAGIRKERGITAKFVAEKVGLSPAMLSAIEREKCNLTIQQAIALAKFFSVSLDYLILGEEDHRLSA